MRVELLQLLEADGARRSRAAARCSRARRTGRPRRTDRRVPRRRRDRRVGRQVARPAVIADRARQMVDLRVVGHQQPAFHRRDVMGVERAERVDVAERAARAGRSRLAPSDSQLSSKKIQAVRVAEARACTSSARRVAEDADGHDHPRARRQRRLELRDVHVERVELDVDEPQLQAVLLQRMEGRRPRDRGHDDFVAALQRTLATCRTAPRRRRGSPTIRSSPSPRASCRTARRTPLRTGARCSPIVKRPLARRRAAIASSSSWPQLVLASS